MRHSPTLAAVLLRFLEVRAGAWADTEPIKAGQLSGRDNLLFRRNSLTGAVEAVAWKREGVELNSELHAND